MSRTAGKEGICDNGIQQVCLALQARSVAGTMKHNRCRLQEGSVAMERNKHTGAMQARRGL